MHTGACPHLLGFGTVMQLCRETLVRELEGKKLLEQREVRHPFRVV